MGIPKNLHTPSENQDLSKYLHECMATQGKVNTTFHLIHVPSEDELAFWIQQFKVRESIGHSEWSDRYQMNIWVSDY